MKNALAAITRFWVLIPRLDFEWPIFLWLLLLVPLAVALYLLLLKRRKKLALRLPNLAPVKDAMGQMGWRRHLPPALMLGAFTLLVIAMARPSAVVSLPSDRATVMLAMDVSGSMRANDVKPTRLDAAKKAAKQYIKDQPHDVEIGIVAFSSTAVLVQSPTTDRVSLNAAVDRFQLQRGTATGSAILVALSTLFPKEDLPVTNLNSGANNPFGNPYGDRFRGRALGDRSPNNAPKKKHVPVAPGSYKNAVIILLSDGASNGGYDPIEAAKIAADYGVRVYTVGIGTTQGAVVGFGGFSMRAQLDDAALKKIADTTRGRYFRAASEADLRQVYNVLSTQLIVETKEVEISAFFAAGATLLLLLSASLSIVWYGRVL